MTVADPVLSRRAWIAGLVSGASVMAAACSSPGAVVLDTPEGRVLQYEGDDHRTNRRRWREDVRRDEMLQEHGWYVMRIVADDVFVHPQALVRRVRSRMERQREVLGRR